MGAADKDRQAAEEETLGVGEGVEWLGEAGGGGGRGDPQCKRASSLERSWRGGGGV